MSTAHRVDQVRFTKSVPSMQSPIECTCGWAGQVAEFALHSGVYQGALSISNQQAAARNAKGQRSGERELFTGCSPSGLPGDYCRNCGRLLMLGGKRTREGRRRVQHAPYRARVG